MQTNRETYMVGATLAVALELNAVALEPLEPNAVALELNTLDLNAVALKVPQAVIQ